MKHFIRFGLISIWCIFSYGCVSTVSNNTDYNNLEHFYLEQYVDDTLREGNYNFKNDREGARQARIDADRNWNIYLRHRAINVQLQIDSTKRQ